MNASLVDGSPVSVRTEIGIYTFNYEIRGLGEFYDTCTTGRLSGASNSVVNKLNKEGELLDRVIVNLNDEEEIEEKDDTNREEKEIGDEETFCPSTEEKQAELVSLIALK